MRNYGPGRQAAGRRPAATIAPEASPRGEADGAHAGAARRAWLAGKLHRYQRDRVRKCRLTRIGPSVQLVSRIEPQGAGRLVIRGTHTCGSVHSCPMCAAAILRGRAAEVGEALDSCSRERTLFVTFTLRHHASIPLRLLRLLLARTYSRLKSGRGGVELRRALAHVGDVRAAEVTWGSDNGWHPHLHALWFLRASPPDDAGAQLSAQWRSAVVATLGAVRAAATGVRPRGGRKGEPYALNDLQRLVGNYYAAHLDELREQLRQLSDADVIPDHYHGVRAEPVSAQSVADYLCKLGCELSAITKSAATGHYTHWQLASEVARGARWAIPLWREYSSAMLGARHLTWSRGCRDALGLAPERPDATLASEAPESADVEHVLATVPGRAWDTLVRQQGHRFVARLHREYDSGAMADSGVHPGAAHTPRATAEDVAPVWWERLESEARARAVGADSWGAAHRTAQARADSRERLRARAKLTRRDRELEVEELRDHLREDYGIGPPSAFARSKPDDATQSTETAMACGSTYREQGPEQTVATGRALPRDGSRIGLQGRSGAPEAAGI